MQMRDPEDRAEGITIGAGRAILSNRISHFLNIKELFQRQNQTSSFSQAVREAWALMYLKHCYWMTTFPECMSLAEVRKIAPYNNAKNPLSNIETSVQDY